MSWLRTTGNIRVTVSGVQLQMEVPVLTSVSWQRSPPTWVFASAVAPVCLGEHFPQPLLLLLFLLKPHRLLEFFPFSFASPPVSSSPSIDPGRAASFIIPTMPIHFLPVIPVATVAVTGPVSTVRANLAGILTHAPSTMTSRVSLCVLSDVPTSAIASSVLAFWAVPSSVLIASASVPVYLASTAVCQSSPVPLITNGQSPAKGPMAFSRPPRGPVIILRRERLARRDEKLAGLDEVIKAYEDCVWELGSYLSDSASTGTMHRSQIVTF